MIMIAIYYQIIMIIGYSDFLGGLKHGYEVLDVYGVSAKCEEYPIIIII